MKPILVMRETTERPEAMDAGAVELVGNSTARIVESVSRLLANKELYRKRQINMNPYGDGTAAERILDFGRSKGMDCLIVLSNAARSLLA